MEDIKEKKHIDMLNGSLWTKILMFAIPLVLIGILEQLFNAADVAVVGHFTGDRGKNAMAAVGATSSIIGLIVYTFIAVSLGVNVVIAHAVGAKNDLVIKRCVHTSIVFSIILGVALTIIAEAFARPIFKTQSIPDEVFDMTITYFRIYSFGIPLILLYNFLASIYRGVGNTKTPLIVLAISGVINLGLNFLFVVGMGMDVEGVALATVISNAISAIILFVMMLINKGILHISFKELKIHFRTLSQILQIGIPAGIQS
ncbi:MAG: polysaccharide biosynthesis C-terminal domain-containing protein, partial [Acholeplasmatales bacterium]|nr:polysaccharide biosynthesis C-terminal domain-containing protein [Acholeplasmatales bacterium]